MYIVISCDIQDLSTGIKIFVLVILAFVGIGHYWGHCVSQTHLVFFSLSSFLLISLALLPLLLWCLSLDSCIGINTPSRAPPSSSPGYDPTAPSPCSSSAMAPSPSSNPAPGNGQGIVALTGVSVSTQGAARVVAAAHVFPNTCAATRNFPAAQTSHRMMGIVLAAQATKGPQRRSTNPLSPARRDANSVIGPITWRRGSPAPRSSLLVRIHVFIFLQFHFLGIGKRVLLRVGRWGWRVAVGSEI